MTVDPYKPRRYSSTDSAAGVMVGKEFVFEKKNRAEEDAMAGPKVAKRLRMDFAIGISVIIAVVLGILCVVWLLT